MPTKFSGAWDFAKKTAARMERNIEAFEASISEYAAKKYVKNVQDAILSQGPSKTWIISAKWIRENAKIIADTEGSTWIKSGKFVSRLRVVEISKGVFFGGAYSKDKYEGDLSMAEIALFGEYGTKYREPNPIFGPQRLATIQEIMPELVNKAKKFITQDSYVD